MIQLMSTLKKTISDKILSEEDSHIPPETDKYLTKYFSDLVEIKYMNNEKIYVTKDNKNVVFLLTRTTLFMEKKYYEELPGFVKFDIKHWIEKKFWVKFVAVEFSREALIPILRFLKYKIPIERFINLKFNNLEIYEGNYDDIYFIDEKEKEMIVLLIDDDLTINDNFYDFFKRVFNLDLFSARIAFFNWFSDYYGKSMNNLHTTNFVDASGIMEERKHIGPVKDNLKK